MNRYFHPGTFFRLIMGVFLLQGVCSAHADSEIGKVKLWVINNGTTVRVYNATGPAAGSGSGTARCTGNIFGGMDLQLTSETAKAAYSKLLAAEVSGQNVVFWYTYTASSNGCTLDMVQSP